ncbi:MAG: hypothetical protein H0W44_00045 [Gammaproteobacteria bacterium]|nr:hypothetical protein [Gammaproteobacteria bacterium]
MSMLVASAQEQRAPALRDLYYGEALYYWYSKDYFNAIVRLDAELIQHYRLDEPGRDPFVEHRNDAELSTGKLELAFRMHQKTGRALEKLINNDKADDQTRNTAAYHLARLYYQKSDFENALQAYNKIKGKLPKEWEDRIYLLGGQIQITQKKYPEAVKLLKNVRSPPWDAYAIYNTGVALMLDGKLEDGAQKLDQIGRFSMGGEEMNALRDKANVALGYRLLQEGYPQLGRPYLDRVRLSGPYSNKTLLHAGWADAAQGQYKRALTPWTILNARDPRDAAVQESLLALPFAYSKLEAYGRAAILYGKAVAEFDKEIDRLDSSILNIMQGKLRDALLRDPDEVNDSFIESLVKTPDAPETRYLLDLMASNDFHDSIKNYRDLGRMKRNVQDWQRSLQAYDDLLKTRKQYYQPLLPVIEDRFHYLDTMLNWVERRRNQLVTQLQSTQNRRDVYALSTKEELEWQRQFQQIENKIRQLPPQPGVADATARLARLKGRIFWSLNTEYDTRLAQTHQHAKELDQLLATLRAQHAVIVRLKKEAYQSYDGYQAPFQRNATSLQSMLTRIDGVMDQQARYLEKVTVMELDRRRQKLADYRVKARFALAESYDRATKKQARDAEEIMKQQQSIIKEERDKAVETPAESVAPVAAESDKSTTVPAL